MNGRTQSVPIAYGSLRLLEKERDRWRDEAARARTAFQKAVEAFAVVEQKHQDRQKADMAQIYALYAEIAGRNGEINLLKARLRDAGLSDVSVVSESENVEGES